jgi:hypothetical protein
MNGVIGNFLSVPDIGAFSFGAVIGWYVYYINRYRKDASAGDITTLVSALGGAAVTGVFKDKQLFGAYSIGLGVGFFGYFALLLLLVKLSKKFNLDFFLDGRHLKLEEGEERGPDQRPMLVGFARAFKEEPRQLQSKSQPATRAQEFEVDPPKAAHGT